MDCRTVSDEHNNKEGISGLNRLHLFTHLIYIHIKVMWLYMRFIQLKGNVFQMCKPKSNLVITISKKEKIHRTNIFAMINIKAWWLESVPTHEVKAGVSRPSHSGPIQLGFSILPGRCPFAWDPTFLGESWLWLVGGKTQLDKALQDWACSSPWAKGSSQDFSNPTPISLHWLMPVTSHFAVTLYIIS